MHYLSSEEEARYYSRMEISRAYGVKVNLVKGDIAKMEDVQRMKEELYRSLGGLDCIVNNAGFAKMKSFFQYELDEWKHEVDTCFYGVLNLVHRLCLT